jgi:hypothetical protein
VVGEPLETFRWSGNVNCFRAAFLRSGFEYVNRQISIRGDRSDLFSESSQKSCRLRAVL